MSATTDLKKTAADTGYVVVGITDLAVERIREAQARAAAVRTDLEKMRVDAELKRLQVKVQQLPTAAVSTSLEAATRAEEAFDGLAARGKSLVQRINRQRATQDLLKQGRNTLSRSKGAVTSVRRSTTQTASAAQETVATAEQGAAETATAAKTTARKQTRDTKTAAERTATTARKRATTSKSATKRATTSARKTADAAVKAADVAASKVGD